MPPPPHAVAPPVPRAIRKVGAPLAVIIVLGTIAGLILVLLTAVNPVGTAIGFALATVALILVLLAYLWLDRWEPEPPRLLILAFLWGASVAVVVSVALEMVVDAAVNSGGADSSPITIALGAPVVEEAAKGLFLLIMMTGARRNELNSLTDCLVYAGVTAIGFAWLENIFYIADGASLSDSLLTAGIRLVMGPFAHPLFTTFTAIGVYFALQQRNRLTKAGCVLIGYLGAVIMHGLWNGSALLGAGAYFGLYFVWMMPVFILAVTLAVRSRRREQRIVAEKLPGMVAAGLITPTEAGWLGTIHTRKQVVAAATGYGGRPAGRGVKKFAIQVVELAFVRDRIDRGFGDARVFALQQLEVDGVVAARAAAGPVLHWLNGYRPPVA
ncbi:protease PrsW [Mycolicibacterium helvum]|uniref:Protease PrsW n=2 Tax=Mycolicibacterium helvum TaxID=1534349 RepID=A0A7I7TG37_9MYCO|nr:PrsW family intramembrane metalloprotease [Mycolicibacterium helvum]BBY67335.1 protease PrsW [Mycolicibacterium helvum]